MTAGCDVANFKKNCAQVVAPNSAAHSRHVVTLDAFPKARAAERQIHEHRDPALPRKRQDRRLGVEIVDGVVDADEVERLVAHELDDRFVLRLERRRHADVAHAPGLLELLEDAETASPCRQRCALGSDRSCRGRGNGTTASTCARAPRGIRAPPRATLSFVAQKICRARPFGDGSAATSSDAPYPGAVSKTVPPLLEQAENTP